MALAINRRRVKALGLKVQKSISHGALRALSGGQRERCNASHSPYGSTRAITIKSFRPSADGKEFKMKVSKLLLGTTCIALTNLAFAAETLTIATVNNADMIRMQRLSQTFEKNNPEIDLNWVVLEENVLRQRLTTDIATQGGQFDVLTIGMYEASLWGDKGWLAPMTDLPADYDLDDVFPSVREGLSVDGTLYALPFYAESSMTYYRTYLFEQAGLQMPEHPTWTQMAEFADKLHRPDQDQYGMCLRGKAGWGENMALVTTVANAFGHAGSTNNGSPNSTAPSGPGRRTSTSTC